MVTYEEALHYIHTINSRGQKRPVASTAALCASIGAPHSLLKFVHVAGTNGKGSTCAMIESILRAAGYRTGLFTSPFITRFNERIRVDGEDIGDMELAELLEELLPVIEAQEVKPSEFELVTILGLAYFMKRACDIVVLEVGVGGELDATNAIETSEVSVITALGMDHVRYLGPTPRDIARAKAGIIKPNGRAVIYADVEGVIAGVAGEKGATLTAADFSKLHVTSHDLEGCRFDFGEWRDLYIPLAGTYQPSNAAVALTAIETLRARGWRISDEHIREGLAQTRWRGRFELLRRDPVFLLDGGHNPQAVDATVRSLTDNLPGRKFTFLFGIMADKDADRVLTALAPVAENFVTIAPPSPRAMPAEELAKLVSTHGIPAVAAGTVGEGVRKAVQLAGPDGAVCALGSLYLLEDIRKAVNSLQI